MATIQHYPLTPGQLLIMYGEKYLPNGAHNICVRVDIESETDESLLRQAVVLSTLRIPSLSLRIAKNGKSEFSQYICDAAPDPVEFLDASDMTGEALNSQMTKWGGSAFSSGLIDKQLYQVKVLRTGRGFSIFICVHHVIMDAFAVMSYVTYIDKLYYALSTNTPLPEPWKSPSAMIENENLYYGSKRYFADKKWFEDMYSQDFVFSPYSPKKGLSLKAKLANPMTSKGCFTNMLIPADTVKKIDAAASQRKVSPGVLYMLAIRSILAHNSNSDDVVFNVIMARRSTLLQKHSGCSIANALPFRTNISNSLSFDEAISEFDLGLKGLYRHASYSCEEAFALLGNAGKGTQITAADPVSVTYQPYFNMDDNNMNFTVQRIYPGHAQSKFYLTIMPCDSSGNMYGNYEHFLDVYSCRDIEEFHAFMLKFLDAGIANPEKSIKQLVDECM